ncbi:MAG: septum formation initiator family protein [Candidatus Binatia bacterium]
MVVSKISQRWVVCGFCAFFILLSLFTIFGERGGLHLWQLWAEKKSLEETNFLLEKENRNFRERIYRLRHDDQYLEKIAREDLSLVRPGDVIYRFSSTESEKAETKVMGQTPFELPRSSGQKSRP